MKDLHEEQVLVREACAYHRIFGTQASAISAARLAKWFPKLTLEKEKKKFKIRQMENQRCTNPR